MVELPEDVAAYFERRKAQGPLRSDAEILRDMVEVHRTSLIDEKMEAELVRRLDDELIEVNDAFWEEVEREGTRRIQEGRAKRER